jgi:integrase
MWRDAHLGEQYSSTACAVLRASAAYTKKLGSARGVAFHSLRHTLATCLAEAAVSQQDTALITGHAVNTRVPTLAKHYIHIADVAALPKRVEVLATFDAGLLIPES